MGCLVWNTAHVLMVSLTETPLTGEPDAGNPPVRFGGRGGANPAIPTSIEVQTPEAGGAGLPAVLSAVASAKAEASSAKAGNPKAQGRNPNGNPKSEGRGPKVIPTEGKLFPEGEPSWPKSDAYFAQCLLYSVGVELGRAKKCGRSRTFAAGCGCCGVKFPGLPEGRCAPPPAR